MIILPRQARDIGNALKREMRCLTGQEVYTNFRQYPGNPAHGQLWTWNTTGAASALALTYGGNCVSVSTAAATEGRLTLSACSDETTVWSFPPSTPEIGPPGQKTHLFAPFYVQKMPHFTKTGSGQPSGKALKKRGTFSYSPTTRREVPRLPGQLLRGAAQVGAPVPAAGRHFNG